MKRSFANRRPTVFLLPLLLLCFVLPAVAQTKKITVSADGRGDFRTVHEAIRAVPDSTHAAVTIFIRNGVYKEKLTIPTGKAPIVLLGEDVQKTIITYDDYASKPDSAGKNIGTSGSSSVFIRGSDVRAENITFENSSGPVGQAVAMWVGGDKIVFKNCRFLGFQDTLYTNGNFNRQYFLNCYIEGTVDFIFGSATAVFENCTIFCKRGGYITAASTSQEQPYGYLFLRCTITGDAAAGTFYLGRPWRPYAHVAFIECTLPAFIRPEGWHNWGKESNEQTARYVEYSNKGAGAATEGRVSWSKQLTKEQAGQYVPGVVFRDWKPAK
ncbi:pectinesterase family protein [Paraflavitalea pollutisoli]|uniref:pectinesterase family protein n=1 Tax=Paraflavitalea pollutisoli TaxID=3034143 RepID=UPI0023EC3CBD|nr:pectinesterase family protein [Paraflavitalea sp. H1-2-19X]